MADLGSIPYTNVNQGTRVVDRSAESRALAQGLNVAKKVVDEGITASVTSDMNEALEGAIEEAVREEENLPPEATGPLSDAEYLRRRVDRLNAVIQQGNSSAVTAARMQIDGILAKAQSRYPWLYNDLRARANAVQAGSQELKLLGIEDERREISAKQAQDSLDAIVNKGRARVKDGGYGIDPSIAPEDPRFIAQYTEASKIIRMQEENALQAGLNLARVHRVLNDDAAYAQLQSDIFGRHGLVKSQMKTLFEDFGIAEVQRELAKGENADFLMIQNWANQNGFDLIARLEQERANIRDFHRGNVLPGMEEHYRGKQFVAALEDTEAFFDNMIAAVKGFNDDIPSAMAQLENLMAIRGNVEYLAAPDVTRRYLDFANGPGKPLHDAMVESRSPGAIRFFDRFNLSNESWVAKRFPEYWDGTEPGSSGNRLSTVVNSSSPIMGVSRQDSGAQVLQTISSRFVDPSNSFVIPTTSNEEQQVAALMALETHQALWEKAEELVPDASPEHADESLLGRTYSLHYMNMDTVRPADAQEEVLEMLSEPSTMRAVEKSLEGGPSGFRSAFGSAAATYYEGSGFSDRRDDARDAFNYKLINGAAAPAEVVTIDVKALNERGEFVWDFNTESKEWKDLVTRYKSQQRTFIGNDRDAQRHAKQAVREVMSGIVAEMNQQIAIERLINKAQADSGSELAIQDTWLDHFYGRGNLTPGSSWSNVFLGE